MELSVDIVAIIVVAGLFAIVYATCELLKACKQIDDVLEQE